MFSSLLLLNLQMDYGDIFCSTHSRISLIITPMLYALFCLLVIPVSMRLANQLTIQVCKYRYIVKYHTPNDDDKQVMTGYYQHFQVFLGIVMCILGFNVFNFVFQIYLSVTVLKQDWGRQYQLSFIVGAFTLAFQEGIMLFGLTLLLQIANYFSNRKFHFKRITIAIILRIMYVFLLDFNTGSGLAFFPSKRIITSSISLSLLYFFDCFIRVFFVFGFVKMTLGPATKYINEFRTDLNTAYLETYRYNDKIQSYKLLRAAAWGTYALNIFSFIEIIFIILISLSSFFWFSFPWIFFELFVYVSGNFWILLPICMNLLSFFSFLPSILYSLFIIVTWFYLRHRTKIKYSGYRTSDIKTKPLLRNKPVFTNQDHLHHTYYKPKNRVLLVSYVVLIISISSTLSLLLLPLMIQKSNNYAPLVPGEYFIPSKYGADACSYSEYSIGYPAEKQNYLENYLFINSPPPPDNCANFLEGWKFQKPLKHKVYTSVYESYGIDWIWLTANSTVTQHNPLQNVTHSYTAPFVKLINSQFPDYQSCNQPNTNYIIVNCSLSSCTIPESAHYSILMQEPKDKSSVLIVNRTYFETIGESIHFSELNENKFDAIIINTTFESELFPSTCILRYICYYNPIWPILFALAVFLASTVCLYLSVCIMHRI